MSITHLSLRDLELACRATVATRFGILVRLCSGCSRFAGSLKVLALATQPKRILYPQLTRCLARLVHDAGVPRTGGNYRWSPSTGRPHGQPCVRAFHGDADQEGVHLCLFICIRSTRGAISRFEMRDPEIMGQPLEYRLSLRSYLHFFSAPLLLSMFRMRAA